MAASGCAQRNGLGAHMKIRNKIIAIVGVVGLSTAALCGMGLYAVSQSRAMGGFTEEHFSVVVDAETIHRLVMDVAFNTRATWMSKDTAEAQPYARKIQGSLAEIDRAVARIEGRLDEDQEKQYFDDVLKALKIFKDE